MRVSYSTAQLAHQAVLDAPEQAALRLLDSDDATGLAGHSVLTNACFARTTRLFDVCLQVDALQCAWLLLQRARPEDDVQARRARRDAMRLSTHAMTACIRAPTCAQKQPMASLATRACDYAVNRGYARASVQVMHAAAEAFFLTAFETPRVLYGGTPSVRQSPHVQLWMSLTLLRYVKA